MYVYKCIYLYFVFRYIINVKTLNQYIFEFYHNFIFLANIYLLNYSSLTVSSESLLKSPPRRAFDFH